jgi:hypothetical protein
MVMVSIVDVAESATASCGVKVFGSPTFAGRLRRR